MKIMDTIKTIMQNYIKIFIILMFTVVAGLACSNPASPPASIPAPVSSSISVTTPNENGFVTITGAAGAVPGSATVSAANVNRGGVVKFFPALFINTAYAAIQDSVVANADGSFVIITIEGSIGEVVRLRFNHNGEDSNTTDKIIPANVVNLSTTLSPRSAAIVDATNLAYVTTGDATNGFLWIFDMTNLQLSNEITINNQANMSAIAIDDTQNVALILNENSNIAIPFNLLTNTAGANIAMNSPQSISASPSGGYFVVGMQDTNSVALVNSTTLLVDCQHQISNTIAPTSNHVSTTFITMETDGFDFVMTLSEFDNDTLVLTRSRVDGCASSPPLATLQQQVISTTSPAGLASYNGGLDLFVTDTASDSVIRANMSAATSTSISVGDQPQGIAVNSGNNTVYVVNSGDNTISDIDILTNDVSTFASETGLGASELVFNPTSGDAILLSILDHAAWILQLN